MKRPGVLYNGQLTIYDKKNLTPDQKIETN